MYDMKDPAIKAMVLLCQYGAQTEERAEELLNQIDVYHILNFDFCDYLSRFPRFWSIDLSKWKIHPHARIGFYQYTRIVEYNSKYKHHVGEFHYMLRAHHEWNNPLSEYKFIKDIDEEQYQRYKQFALDSFALLTNGDVLFGQELGRYAWELKELSSTPIVDESIDLLAFEIDTICVV